MFVIRHKNAGHQDTQLTFKTVSYMLTTRWQTETMYGKGKD